MNFGIGDIIKNTKSSEERIGIVACKQFWQDFEEPWYTIDIIKTKTNNIAYKTIRVYGANDWVLLHKKEEFEK